VEGITLLLDRGADIHAKRRDDRTVLHEIVSTVLNELRQENLAALLLLLGRGAVMDAKDVNGQTALDLAKSAGYLEAVKILEERMTQNTS
jgi:ankyrin repeat protein